MEKTGTELEGQELDKSRESICRSFSYDGYEQLHDEAMDNISVSIQYSDYEETLSRASYNNLTSENQEKKMKISLSQEQLRLNVNPGNFLTVPGNSRKFRSAALLTADKNNENKAVRINPDIPTLIESGFVENNEVKIKSTVPPQPSLTETTRINVINDEIVYAVPRRYTPKPVNEITTSSASLSPWKSVVSVQTSSTSTAPPNRSFEYPLAFYCTICNNLLSDPRTLDCLHSFCLQCLARLDASNDLQNNQFWRKISEHSDSSCK